MRKSDGYEDVLVEYPKNLYLTNDLYQAVTEQLLKEALSGNEQRVLALLSDGVSVLFSNTFAKYWHERTKQRKALLLKKLRLPYDVIALIESYAQNYIDFLMLGAYIILLFKKGNNRGAMQAIEEGLIPLLDEFHIHGATLPNLDSIRRVFVDFLEVDAGTLLKLNAVFQFSETELAQCVVKYMEKRKFINAFEILKANPFKNAEDIKAIKSAINNTDNADILMMSRDYLPYSTDEEFRGCYLAENRVEKRCDGASYVVERDEVHSNNFNVAIQVIKAGGLGVGVKETGFNCYQMVCKTLITKLTGSISGVSVAGNRFEEIMKLNAQWISIEIVQRYRPASERLYAMLKEATEAYNKIRDSLGGKPSFFGKGSRTADKLRTVIFEIGRQMPVPNFIEESGYWFTEDDHGSDNKTITLKPLDETYWLDKTEAYVISH